ncbi:MAG TPA: hypothetical protein ENJ82_01690 [Bacteroidetes bacterium]|nr:hypothetical protein [Bacteroidota bacterium]
MIHIPKQSKVAAIAVFRLAGHWLSSKAGLADALAAEYSRMKYGDPAAARSISQELAKLLLRERSFQDLVFPDGKRELVVAASAYGSIPPSAVGLMEELHPILERAGLSVKTIKIERQGGFSRMDYDALDRETREKVVQSRRLSLDAAAIETLKGQVVLLVDDLRSTGAHERALIQLLTEKTEVKAIVCLYWIGFSAPLDAEGPEHEAGINHAYISRLDDLAPTFFQAEDPPRLNARVLKFILRGGRDEKGDRLGFFRQLPIITALRLYEAALSRDGYFYRPDFREGFRILEDFLFAEKHISARKGMAHLNARENKVVRHNLYMTAKGQFLDAETDADLSNLLREYSRFKFGGVPEIRVWARDLAQFCIAEVEAGRGPATVFKEARQSGAYIYLVAPGVRNVISASNFLLREFAQHFNIWLSQNGGPTLIVKPITRLGSGRANYAALSANERKNRKKSTQSIIPRREFEEHPIHVIFLDDVEVTGTTADRARKKYLAAGAQSFHTLFALRVVPETAKKWAGIEHAMNQFALSGKLDSEVAKILAHPDYQPVQRMLRLLLHPDNRADLANFARNSIPAQSRLRLYQGAMANDYLWINPEKAGELGFYGPSLRIFQHVMQELGQLDAAGMPL